MHIAMRDFLDVQQLPVLPNDVNNLRIRIPDFHSAEQRQRLREHAVTLHRIDDFVIGHAMRFARHEVFDAVGRR